MTTELTAVVLRKKTRAVTLVSERLLTLTPHLDRKLKLNSLVQLWCGSFVV